jgi:TolB-like protein
MIRRDHLVKVLDFGLAKLTANKSIVDNEGETKAQVKTATGMIMGTAAYMSPEQARGIETDARTDVFSLGVVIYEMIAGCLPFAGETMSDTIAAILKTEPAPLARFAPDVPRQLERIVGKALRKDREERYQHIKDLLIDVRDLKQELEFEAKMERNKFGISPSNSNSETRETQILEVKPTAGEKPPEGGTLNLSSAEYIAGEIKNHKLGLIVFLVLMLAAIGFGYRFFFNHSSNIKQIESIAVLPFENGSGDANLEYLSDGMTESLISSLSQLPNLNVKARNSVFRYKGKSIEQHQIARELNVQAILTGRIVERGQDLILYIELVDAATENVLWKTDYNRPVTNLLALQSEIARDVSGKLKIKLSGADEQKIAKNYTQNAEAYQLYLKGNLLRQKVTPQDGQKAVAYFEQAVALDPNFALAYVGLSDTYGDFSSFMDLPPSNYQQKSREFILKALSLDDRLPEAHASFGGMLLGEYDFAGAEREMKRAVELNPNYANAHLGYGHLLAIFGRREEADAELRHGLELDPISVPTNWLFGASLFYARRYDESIAQMKKTLELDANYFPAHAYLGAAYEMTGDYAASVAERVKINELVGTKQRAEAMQKSFDKGGWQGFLRDATGEHPSFNVPPYILATYHAALGEKDKALSVLNKLYENRDRLLPEIKVDPRFDNLRDDPRFSDLLRRIGLQS